MKRSSGSPQFDPLISAARRAAAELDVDPSPKIEQAAETPKGPVEIEGYALEEEIQRGGQGIVYRALQISTGRQVAIKVLRRGRGPDGGARFEREVQLLAALDHENIVAVHASGSLPEWNYLVMDYVPGLHLDEYVERRGLTVRATLDLFLPICRAVEAAHLRGILHRDLKPANIRVDGDGRPRVLDFGVARQVLASGEAHGVTGTGQFVGSLPWASPEQTRQDPDTLDLRSDVYSLGVMLYSALTGRFPYEVAGNLADVLGNIANVVPAAPSAHRPEIEPDVDAIVLAALRKERDARYQGAGELARDLASYLQGEPVQARGQEQGYLLRRALVRHRTAALVAAGYVFLATVAAAGLLVLWNAARREEASAKRSAEQELEARSEAEAERARLERSHYFHSMNLAQVALDRGNGGRALALLEQAPEHLRGIEWAHLNWRRDRSAAVLQGDGGAVLDVAYSPDGKLVASAESGGSLRLWHVGSGAPKGILDRGGPGWKQVCFSGDGRSVVGLGRGGGVAVFDREQLARRTALCGPGGASAIAPAAGRGWWLGAEDGSLRLVDGEGEVRSRLPGSGAEVVSLAARPQGDSLLVGDAGGGLVEWDVAAAQPMQRYPATGERVLCLAWTVDGQRFASGGSDGLLRVWRRASTAPLQEREGHGAWVYDVAWSAGGGKLISSGADHSAKLWDAESGALLATLRGHGDRVFAAAADPQGQGWATGSRDGTLRLWPAAPAVDGRILGGHAKQVWALAFHPDGQRLASASADRTVALWDVKDARVTPALRRFDQDQTACAWSQGGGLVASGGKQGGLVLWGAQGLDALRVLGGHVGRVSGAAFIQGDRSLVSAGMDPAIIVWDCATGDEHLRISDLPGMPFALAVDPEGERALVGLTGGIGAVYDLRTGAALATLDAHAGAVWGVAWSPVGDRFATAGNDGSVRVWDAADHSMSLLLDGHRDAVRCVAFSPDGERIASGGWDATVRLWDARSGAEALTLIGHSGRVEALVFDGQGTRLASSSVDGEVFVWETARK